MQPRMVVFHAVKRGNAEHEWEDAAAGDPTSEGNSRFAVADGATEAFGAASWARCLVSGFVGADGATPPALRRQALRHWLTQRQTRWNAEQLAAGGSDLARLKLERVGSFATLLGCELSGLDGDAPCWNAVALGDTVLFQVRGPRLVEHFPPIAAEDFGVNPDGVSSKPEQLASTTDRLAVARGGLALGDRLYLATDAFAQWMLATQLRDPEWLWATLAALAHPVSFRALVADRRRRGEMTNDDVTLLRVHLVTGALEYLVVCL